MDMQDKPAEPDPPPMVIPIDRTQALVRGLWRLACAAVLVGPMWLVDVDGRLLWQTQRATALALVVLYALLAIGGLSLLVYAIRWMVLAAWPRPLCIAISPASVAFCAGPWGKATYPWAQIRVGLDAELDDAPLEALLNHDLLPFMRHPDCDEDLALRIQRLAGLRTEQLSTLLMPYFKRSLSRSLLPFTVHGTDSARAARWPPPETLLGPG